MESDSLYMEEDSMKKKKNPLTRFILKIPEYLGTPISLFLHAIGFIVVYVLIFIGLDAEQVQLALTTVISIEAIFLSLLIQMTMNQHHRRLKDVEEDIDDILEDTEQLTEEDE